MCIVQLDNMKTEVFQHIVHSQKTLSFNDN